MFSLKKKKNIKNIEEASDRIEKIESEIKKISEHLKEKEKEAESLIQSFGLVRYNPFNELGGDQSFSLALLDKNNNGFIITSIYTKDNSRIYSKPIVMGGSVEYQLSKEEKEAIGQAKSKKNKI